MGLPGKMHLDVPAGGVDWPGERKSPGANALFSSDLIFVKPWPMALLENSRVLLNE
jgi:hypothetical protein